MAWDNMNRVVGSNGQVTMTPGHLQETITLLDWSDAANNGVSAYTSKLSTYTSDYTVLLDFSHDIDGDTWLRIEQSIDGTTWTSVAQSGTTNISSANLTEGTDISRLAYIDDSDESYQNTGYYFVYEADAHGKSKYIRFSIEDMSSLDRTTHTITWYLIPH
tara:strand:- start:160 stop:642 length:483 start_codon:yes stop_codon:yes gene_type:complete